MSTVDAREDGTLTVHAKGAPEEILAAPRASAASTTTGRSTESDRREVLAVLERYASQGLRVLAVARRRLPDGAEPLLDARMPSASSACSAWWRCSTRRVPRSPMQSPAAMQPGFASSS